MSGRQLLAVRNRLRGESDPAARRKLLRREVRLLVDLGNLREAEKSARRILEENPEWPGGHSILADMACRTGDWMEAEELFGRAALMLGETGDREGAARLRTGPLYRLAEARGDHAECSRLCADGGALGQVLACRAARRSGATGSTETLSGEGFLTLRLAALEEAWRGYSPRGLLELAEDWGNTEPEWRWRLLVEAIGLWRDSGLDVRKWRRPVRDTVCPVLDPRFSEEWRRLDV